MSQTGSDLVPRDDGEIEVIEEVEEAEPTLAEQQAAVTDELARAQSEFLRLSQEMVAAASGEVEEASTGDALVPASGSADAAKARLSTLRASALRREQSIRAMQDGVKRKQDEIAALMRKQMQLAAESLAPLERYVAKLQEGIWMVNLYLGRDEEIVLLRDGEPAAADTPVAIRQMVLAMDQECAADPEGGGIDATDIEAFDEWLQADPAHVDQVIPDVKGVVALRPRWDHKDYGDAWKNRAVAAANERTYFLIRNGERLFRTWTEFKAGKRLVPHADEFTGYFFEEHRDWDAGHTHRIPITPGTLAWERAEEKADARKRHYMRVALILQGLVDRTTVFHPLPEVGVNFLDFDHNGRTWKFVIDGEGTLTTTRQPFFEWLREKNRQLRVGMRIVGAFHSRYHDDWDGRIFPRNAEAPPSGGLLTIEDEQGDGWIVRYPRGEVWDKTLWVPSPDRPGWGHRGGYRPSKRRAAALLLADDTNFIPFDLVSEEEMLAYLGARLDRHAYVAMFPLLKQAIKAKRAERVEEQPFRTMLAGVLARDNGVSVADAERDLDDLIVWWKLTNKTHRPLVGDEESQAKAVRMIVDEHGRRLNAKAVDDAVVARVLRVEPDAMLIARKRDGKYVALVPEDDRNVYLREVEFGARGNRTGEPKRWRTMPSEARRAKWSVAYTTGRFEGWDFYADAKNHLTGPEWDALAAEVTANLDRVLAVGYDAADREFHTWRLLGGARVDPSRPLSAKQIGPEVEHTERRWTRTGGGEVVLRPDSRSWRSGWNDQRKPWDTRTPEREKPSQWSREKNVYEVLYANEALDAEREAEIVRWKEADRLRSDALAEAFGLLDSIKTAWQARRTREVYDRFLEDYLDPELWEGHRKTLPRGTFDYPHRHYRGMGRQDEPDALALLVEHAVETGIDLDGLTVQEAAEHYPSVEWIEARNDGDVFKPRVPRVGSIPVDVLDLRFKRPDPGPEGDDEDWDDDET